jgi:hypothetical protein
LVLPLLSLPLARIRHMDVALVAFWSAYLALWPGVLWWWSRI